MPLKKSFLVLSCCRLHPPGARRAVSQVGIHVVGGHAASAHGADDRRRAGDDIASGPDTLHLGASVGRVRHHRAVARAFKARSIGEYQWVRARAQGHDHRIHGHIELAALDGDGAAPPRGIRFT